MTEVRADLTGTVVAVHRKDTYSFSKESVESINLIAGLGVEGDAHLGATVQHRSRVKRDPSQPNLRQVHLIRSELLDEVGAAGHEVPPGALGENITTAGIDLVGLPVGSILRLGESALVAITGLRNPCGQIEGFSTGLLKKMFAEESGIKVGRTGVMGMVVAGGVVKPADAITVRFPAGVLTRLEKV